MNVAPSEISASGLRPAEPTPRYAALDALRTAALVGMFVYHFSWDLVFMGLLRVNVGLEPGWRLFAHVIASSFLGLVGIGLVLAHRQGFRPRAYLRRLARIAAAAILVSAVTWFLAGALQEPEMFIYFGILHSITLASILALPFLWLPAPVTALAAVACLIAPAYLRTDALDTPLGWGIGLAVHVPPTVDLVPVLPWLAAALAGVLLGRGIVHVSRSWSIFAWQPQSGLARGVVWAGRHTLLIYLIHQPVLFGLAYVLAMAPQH